MLDNYETREVQGTVQYDKFTHQSVGSMGSLLCIRIPLAKTFLGFPASFLALVFWNSILIQRGGFIWWESYSKRTCGIVYK